MHSFGHAAYFGLGAYGAALLVKWLALPMGLALAAAPVAALARRAAVRLVRGAAGRRLSRHDHAGLRADRLGAGVPMGGLHRRLQRRDRHLAAAAVRRARRLFPADAGAHGGRRAAVAPAAVRALRLRHARRPRQSAARRGDRHRRQARALARLRHCRRGVRRRRRSVRLRQGLDLAGDHPHQPLDRRPGHGAARRRPDADRPDRRRRRLHHAAGHGDARHPVLARACSAASSWRWCCCFPSGIVGGLARLARQAAFNRARAKP